VAEQIWMDERPMWRRPQARRRIESPELPQVSRGSTRPVHDARIRNLTERLAALFPRVGQPGHGPPAQPEHRSQMSVARPILEV